MRNITLLKGTAGILVTTMLVPLFFLAFYIPAHTARAQGSADDFVNSSQVNGGNTNTVGSAAGGIASCFPTFLLKQAMGRVYSFIAASLGFSVKTEDGQASAQVYGEDILNCIAWALVNTILKKLAADIIDWINRGFQGKPAFLQDFNRFLLGIADQEIGKFIEGSGLSFLCSPFQLQVRIALARRFSQRSTPSCTLTGAVGNVQGFLNNFQNGGWNSFLAFTTSPQNNPYGGYILAESSLSIAISGRQNAEIKLLDFGKGFLSFKEKYDCKKVTVAYEPDSPGVVEEQCKERITTPGATIENSLNQALGSPQRRLEIATEINQILEALFTALITKALQGLAGLSRANAYSDDYYRFNPSPVSTSYNPITGIVLDPNAPFSVKVESPELPCSNFNACPDVSRAGRGSQLSLIAFGGANLPATNTAIAFYLEREGQVGTSTQYAIAVGEQKNAPRTWTIPAPGTFPCGIDAICINGSDIVDGASYRIVAQLYSPANACFGFCPATPSYTVHATAVSLPFVITATSGVDAGVPGSFTDQLRADNEPGTGSGLAQQIETVISIEQRVRDIKEQNIFDIQSSQSLLLSLESCWKGKAGQLSGDQATTASNNASNARLASNALESRKDPFKAAMAQIDLRIAKLRNLQARANSAQGTAQAAAILDEFTKLRAEGGAAGAVDVSQAETELQKTKADMAALDQSTNEKLNQCAAYPQSTSGSTDPFNFNSSF